MKALKSLPKKKTGKSNREWKVLLGLIEYYIKTGKPVGSNTLKEAEFGELSSATIRNYFANLENEGYLSQQHSSGGRIPTNLAFRLYAQEFIDKNEVEPSDNIALQSLIKEETRELIAYLQQAAERLSNLTQTAVFLSAPRFDHDLLIDVKLVSIDPSRCLCIMITDFGMVQTEILNHDQKLSAFAIKRIENYFHWRLTGIKKPENLSPEEEVLAQRFYNEMMIRFIIGSSYGMKDQLYQTGFSKLLNYPELHDPQTLAHSLAMFENSHSIRLLLKECSTLNHLKVWIGEDLSNFSMAPKDVAIIAAPYHVHHRCVGAIGLLGPVRIPYCRLFGILRTFAENISDALTRSIYKYKISFRPTEPDEQESRNKRDRLLDHSNFILLEDKSINIKSD